MHLVGFIRRICHDARSPERKKNVLCNTKKDIDGHCNMANGLPPWQLLGNPKKKKQQTSLL